MPTPRNRPQPLWLVLGLAVSLCLSFLSPVADAIASTNLVSGDETTIAYANGDTVRMRSKAGSAGAIVGEFSEGTPVRIIDGPTQASDGSFWYRVAVEGQSGYMAAEFLADPGTTPVEPTPNPVDEPEETPGAEETPQSTAVPVSTNPTPSTSKSVTGSATIVNTNGDSIRCRALGSADAAVVAQLIEGTIVQLTGSPENGWQPVICDDRDGWVHIDFIGSVGTATVTPEPTVEMSALSGNGTITGTNGDGARCRAKASTSGTILTVLSEGSSVALRGSASGDWQPVVCNGTNGYVFAEFVSVTSSGTSGTGSGSIIGAGVIANTNGMGIRCRKAGSLDGVVLTVLVEGDQVDLRGTVRNGWRPVYCDGMRGYVFADFVQASSGGGGGSGGGGNTGGNSGGGLSNGDTAAVTGTGGTGVRLRSGASTTASVITVASEGSNVTVRSGSTGSWVAVTFQGLDGFIHQDYLTLSAGNGGGGGNSGGTLGEGAHAVVNSTLNFRSEASATASIVGVATEGTVVLITGSKTNSYFPVEWGGMPGFMHGDYLEWTDAELTPGSTGVGGDAGSGSGSADGLAMVNYAMNYLGYPYIWATAGPNSFDCSGFTYWVTLHILGDDIGRGTWTQSVSGVPVSYGSLQPGDLVFFQNTYTWGLSHVGIYIGNNQFIHAENEETGVRISSLTSNYYSTRWYGAVRLT